MKSIFKVIICLSICMNSSRMFFAQEDFTLLSRWAYGRQEEMYFHPNDQSIGYFSSGANLVIEDFSDPLFPEEIGQITVDKFIHHFILVEDRLYISDDLILWIFDISNPLEPVFTDSITLNSITGFLAYDGTFLYRIIGTGIQIYSLENIDEPEFITQISLEDRLWDLAFNGDFLYGANRKADLKHITVIDLKDIENPIISEIELSDFYINSVEIVGSYLYVAGRDSLYIMNIENPALPQLERTEFTGWLYDISVDSNYVFFARQGHNAKIYNVDDPLFPNFTSEITASAFRIRVMAPYVFTLTGGPIEIHEITDITNPVSNISRVSPGGAYSEILVHQGYGYVPNYQDILLFDLNDSNQPVLINKISAPSCEQAVIRGNYCFIAQRWSGWRIVDISDKEQPELIVELDSDDRVQQIQVDENYVYLADWGGGIAIYDVSDPSDPQEIGRYTTERDFERLILVDTYVYAFERSFGLKVIDVSDKSSPQAVDSIAYNGRILDLIQYDTLMYLGADGGRILDISDPGHPIDLGIENNWWGGELALSISDNHLFVASDRNDLNVYNLENPLDPQLVSSYSEAYSSDDVQVVGDLVYLLDQDAGFFILQYSGPTTEAKVISKNTKTFSIWPNPARDHIQVQFHNTVEKGHLLQIRDYMGKLYFNMDISSQGQRNLEVDISNLPAGLFIVSVQGKEGMYVQKLVNN